MQVGITGGIGAGKSIVCRIFQILGIPVYDADTRARQLMEESPGLREKIITTFGRESYTESGKLNRPYLAALVFDDHEKVQELNNLVHPQVAVDYREWAAVHESQFPYTIKEAALLIESGSYRELDYLVTVLAPENVRIDRVLNRDPNRKTAQVEAIIQQQTSDRERIEKSDKILYNDDGQPLVRQILDLHHYLFSRLEGS